MKIFIKGLNSCAMRKQNVQVYQDFVTANGHEIVITPSEADKIILWTCAFREDVRDNSIAEINRYAAEFKGEIVVAGCLPDITPELLVTDVRLRIINWRNDQREMEKLFGGRVPFSSIPTAFVEDNYCSDVDSFRQTHPEVDATFQDQFIKLVIAEGCNYECSYCSERLAFPPYRSFPEDALVEKCRVAINRTGHTQVILIADSLGDYGLDIGSCLPSLMEKILQLANGVKIALGNLNPDGFIRYQEKFQQFLQNGVIRHINLPIQSASDRMLSLMKRPYNKDDINRIFNKLRELNFIEFDTHLLIGFPGESDQDFEETLEFILHHKPKYVLASGYMETKAMSSARIPNKVDVITRKMRLRELESRLHDAGIICNIDDSELISERFKRLNGLGS